MTNMQDVIEQTFKQLLEESIENGDSNEVIMQLARTVALLEATRALVSISKSLELPPQGTQPMTPIGLG